ncbi:N-acetyldiaminopimelate deacetylase [Periweissella cryptocerci]|uniref:N-acetyldiaminopimelate deacetylase n=1 Tax=Periweissella cryptocerci TaxID=2506420 RepID=A0A4P6YWA5_9LACO|nr:N-acetyldiaminopimelate deacetylase [Periweissella cryptocerci]QBO37053.1 N-acetyldiaminopimelate deacetylase [Periweissella cryptocerci]
MVLTEAELINIRRELHQIPELALAEFTTIAKIRAIVGGFDQTYLETTMVPELPTAWLVKVNGSNPVRTIGYRTDIDGLPIEEATGLPFSSVHPGRMHACGHDIHMSVALGLLSYFAENQPTDNLIFIFQPAEESISGGKLLYDSGILQGDWQLDEIYGLHDNPSLPVGTIGCRPGTLFAGTTEINLQLTGKGGHAAFPHLANDMVVALSSWVTQLQTIVSRNVDPIVGGVVTIGQMHAGTTSNVIAGQATADGTIRALEQTTIEAIQERVRQVTDGIALSFDCEAELILKQDGYLPVENDPELTTNLIDYMAKTDTVNYVEVAPAMTGEDFGYLLAKIPGAMFWLGVDSPYSLHSEHLAPNEAAIQMGIDAICGFLIDRMQQAQ